MNQLTLSEIQQETFAILKTFDTFCCKHNIRYVLSNGTLLGAVKYGGFIPWDDDVDVLVPREDYNRLITIFEDGDEHCLFSFERNPHYLFPFAKLCNIATRKEEININNGVDLGVDIDIFPLDTWDNDLQKAKREAKYIKKNISRLGLSKITAFNSPSWVKQCVIRAMIHACKIFGSRVFLQNIIRKSNSAEQMDSDYLGCKAWCIYGNREIIPAEVFASTVEVSFEGEMFPAPVGYDVYLRSLYGDYLKDPPIEKQKTHHSFIAYRL